MKDAYFQEPEPNAERYEDVGYHMYIIRYNEFEKKIFDENYEVAVLKKLKKK